MRLLVHLLVSLLVLPVAPALAAESSVCRDIEREADLLAARHPIKAAEIRRKAKVAIAAIAAIAASNLPPLQ